ncbi:MAG: SAM-dependent methyltransferase [Hyphomicrobiaceae bacterium]
MSGFSAEWLALREPVDHAAINHALRMRVVRYFAEHRQMTVVDLGSGTGSNLRSLAPNLTPAQTWRLLDVDADLLARAAQSASGLQSSNRGEVTCKTLAVDLAGTDLAPFISDADLVTASALFDLVSEEAISRMVAAICGTGTVFYTTLIYDGIVAWLPEAHLDSAMRTAFNRHQMTDKGFGQAAGPTAASVLAKCFTRAGYVVHRAKSPWVLTDAQKELRCEVDRGWASAVSETGAVGQPDASQWLATRQAEINAVTIVSHEDLLALPPSR